MELTKFQYILHDLFLFIILHAAFYRTFKSSG